jgi:hypothetical protein
VAEAVERDKAFKVRMIPLKRIVDLQMNEHGTVRFPGRSAAVKGILITCQQAAKAHFNA